MEWIDIKQTLPTNGKPVLITDGKIVTASEPCVMNERIIYFSAHGFVGYDMEEDFEESEITHWAELPKPPVT